MRGQVRAFLDRSVAGDGVVIFNNSGMVFLGEMPIRLVCMKKESPVLKMNLMNDIVINIYMYLYDIVI